MLDVFPVADYSYAMSHFVSAFVPTNVSLLLNLLKAGES